MNKEATTRIRTRISTKELKRRWKAVRQAMKEQGLDFLILQNCTDFLGGYVKWFTDMPAAHNYPVTVIFSSDDEITTISHGPRPPAQPFPPEWALQGVTKRISVPIIPSLGYSSVFDAEMAVEELKQYQDCRIGLVGMGFISAAFYKYLTEQLTTAKLQDATDLVDNIKAIKSDEEIHYMRETCALQDAAFEYSLTRVKPGRRESEVYADVMHKCLEMGSEQAIIKVGSAPVGTAAPLFDVHYSNRVIEEGDQFNLLIESNAPSGFYAEILRTICLGKVSPELKEQFEVAQKAQKMILEALKPGAIPADIRKANNDFMKKLGYPEETRIFAHGQGYDLVERPSMDNEETMKIQARMTIAVHPSVVSSKASACVSECYLVTETGEKECLHKTPQKIFVI